MLKLALVVFLTPYYNDLAIEIDKQEDAELCRAVIGLPELYRGRGRTTSLVYALELAVQYQYQQAKRYIVCQSVVQAARQVGIARELALAVAIHESRLRVLRGRGGEIGPIQVKAKWHCSPQSYYGRTVGTSRTTTSGCHTLWGMVEGLTTLKALVLREQRYARTDRIGTYRALCIYNDGGKCPYARWGTHIRSCTTMAGKMVPNCYTVQRARYTRDKLAKYLERRIGPYRTDEIITHPGYTRVYVASSKTFWYGTPEWPLRAKGTRYASRVLARMERIEHVR